MKKTGDAYLAQFSKLSFEEFRRLAKDKDASRYEKIGFPNAYREGKENLIFADIIGKLSALGASGKTVVDVGPGCSDLPFMLIELCRQQGHRLVLIDSQEMLDHLPDADFITKIPAYYPDCPDFFSAYAGKVDVLLSYSVLHYVFEEGNVWRFLDRSLQLLAPGGQLLFGDIPNVSRRKRFFASEQGVQYHKAFTGRDENPVVEFNTIEYDKIDDAVLSAMMQRARLEGFDAYLLPQDPQLPMANRREDFVAFRP
jgi:SAM-dependent methyltransferase